MTVKSNGSSVTSLRSHLLFGGAAAALLVFGVGGWAATAELSGAVKQDRESDSEHP